MHDVCWPYGRRDLYYAPERIPEEFRQPYAQRGIRPGTDSVLPHGGINPRHDNALVEGGPRNGVMTALDDFIAEYDRPLRRLVLPVYFGLAIVVEEDAPRRASPSSRALLDSFESRRRQGRAARAGGVDAPQRDPVPAQRLLRPRRTSSSSAAGRYLDLLGAALLNELYLDHELRLRYLRECIEDGKQPQRS